MKSIAQPEPLVGRRRELAFLGRALDGLAAGNGAYVALVGEPGIGKSRLGRALLRGAEERGRQVLEGRGTEFEQEQPFGLVIDALDDHLGSLEPRFLQQLGGEQLAELESVFPSLADLGDELGTPLPAERYRFHQAVLALLERLGQAAPLVIMLDDLHWADEASLELVVHLLRRPPNAPLLLLLAYRPRAAARPLAAAVASAAREGLLTEIQLTPLGEREADQLIGEGLDADTRRAIRRDSGGNPFYLTELARAARGGGRHADSRGGSGKDGELGLPAAVSSGIEEEVMAVSPGARTVLRAAAVAGEPFDPALAAEVAGVDEETAFGALDELLGVGLIRALAPPGRFAFRHPIVRHAVYQAGGVTWRRRAHARAAHALELRGGSVASRAHHVERSAQRGDEEAIDLLTLAGHAAGPRAPAAAADWFGAALRILPETADEQRRLALLIPRAVALGAIGQMQASRAALAEALRFMPEEVCVLRARIVAAAAHLDHLLGRHGAARKLLTDSLERVEDHGSKTAVELKLELTVDHWLANEWDAMTELSGEALAAARRLGHRPLHAHAAAMLAVAELHHARVHTGLERIREASDIVDNSSDDELANRIGALHALGLAENSAERFLAATRHVERAIAISRATGQGAWFRHLVDLCTVAKLSLGELEEASKLAEGALESALLGPDEPLTTALTTRSWICRLEGDLTTAVAAGERALEMRERVPLRNYDWLVGCTLGAARIEAGQPELGRELILREGAGASLVAVEPLWRPHWWAILARADLDLGRVSAAERWVERAEEAAEALELSGQLGHAQGARAAVLLARGDAAAAARIALEASRHLDEAEQGIDAARALLLAGRALAAAGEHERAIGELERAHSQLAARGAAGYRDEAARELRRLGRRLGAAAQAGSDGVDLADLDEQERELSGLVARALTNREIAGELFVSEKTVERRLSRIFRKLGLSSRAQLAAMVERHSETP